MGFSSIECGDHIDHNDICGKCLFCEIDKLEAEVERLRRLESKQHSSFLEQKAEVDRLRESLLAIHDRSSDAAFVFFESAHALEMEDGEKASEDV